MNPDEKKQLWTISYTMSPQSYMSASMLSPKDIENFLLHFPDLEVQLTEFLQDQMIVEDFTEANKVIARIKSRL